MAKNETANTEPMQADGEKKKRRAPQGPRPAFFLLTVSDEGKPVIAYGSRNAAKTLVEMDKLRKADKVVELATYELQ